MDGQDDTGSIHKNYKVKIVIQGEVGVGKSIIWNLIWDALARAKYPHGFTAKEEHTIYCSLPD